MNIIAYGDGFKNDIYYFHSGFEKIDNFVNHAKEFISISSNNTYLASNTIIVDDFISGEFSKVIIKNNNVLIDNQNYELDSGFKYNSSFKYPEISISEIQVKINNFLNKCENLFPAKSLIFLLNPVLKRNFVSLFDRAYVEQMEYAFSLFQKDFFISITEFKSRGGGLTPSGDDFIAGLLFGIDCLEQIEKKNYDYLKKEIIKISKTNNLFSSNMIGMAGDSKYFKRLKEFLFAFFYLTLESENYLFNQLISVGDTSGADLISGFFTILLYKPKVFNE